MILLRSPGGRGADFAAALARQGIPSAFAESTDFFSTMEIATVLSLLELIDNPRQDVPLIAVLRSPLFGFSPSRLAVIRGGAREGDFLDALRADGGEDCRSVLAELEEKLAACRRAQEACGSDYVRLQELTDEQERLSAELDEKTERWVYLNDLKEKIDTQNG